MIFKRTEKGQALVLIVLAAVGLFGFAALAIDGSMVFSDRRHAQNAADTAAYAAALTRVRGGDWKLAGEKRAASNSYANDGVSVVKVYSCLEWLSAPENITGEECKGLPPSPTNDIREEYIIVWIKSVVKLTFARVIGRSEVTNYSDAIVHTTLPEITPWYNGQSLVSTMMGCPPTGYPHDPFTVTGSSGTVVTNSGIMVNSSCTHPDAYDQGGSSSVQTDEGVCVIGDASATNTDPPPNHACDPIDPDIYTLPVDPQTYCTSNGVTTEISSKNYVATPGNYNDPFPTPSQAGTLKLQRGIYCLHDGINLNGTWNLSSDLDGDGHDSDTEGVLFYVPHGDITFNGSSYYDLHAINSMAGGISSSLLNYLIYVPPTNANTIKITGDNGSKFIGTILAPASYIVLNGGSGTVGLDTQIIGYAIAIEGNGTLDINFTQANNAITTTKPIISPTE